MIRIPTHIQRSRHGVYFFRIVVPRSLRKAFDGRGEIKKSLGTRDLRDAMRAARPMALRAFELFARVEVSMSRPPTVDEVLANADRLRELQSTSAVRLPGGGSHHYTVKTDSSDPAEIEAFHAEVARQQEVQNSVVAGYRERPLEVPKAMADYQRSQAEEMERFKEELAAARAAEPPSREKARADQGGAERDEEGAAPFRPDPENILSRRWREYVRQSEGNNWTAGRTTPASKGMFEEFMAWWGKDVDIRFVDRKLINRFIVHLQTERTIRSGRRKGEAGLNARTVDNYITVLNGLMMWAQDKEYFPQSRRLPTAKQAIVKKAARVRRKDKANPPYSPAQLIKLFDPKAYQFKLAHHFWPPLIALFSGARRREIAQLLVEDFRVVDGIPAFSIDNLDDEDKSVKTEASKRMIPVHPELIAIGLLDYVADVRALGLGPELFPGIGTNNHGEKGNAVGNAWRRHREKLGVAGEGAPTFHSFRSVALKVLKANGVSFEMRCQLAGHDMDHVSQSYDDTPMSVRRLMEEGIPHYRYDGLDFSGIRYKRQQFDRTNINGSKTVALSESRIAMKQDRKKAAAATTARPTRSKRD